MRPHLVTLAPVTLTTPAALKGVEQAVGECLDSMQTDPDQGLST
jgi:hypothetical protein